MITHKWGSEAPKCAVSPPPCWGWCFYLYVHKSLAYGAPVPKEPTEVIRFHLYPTLPGS